METVFQKLFEVAKKSEGIGRRKSYRLAAGIISRGRLLNAKPPLMRTHPLLAQFSQHPYLHAETNAIISHGLDNCNGLDIAVARVHLDGTPSMASPCPVCRRVLESVGIRKVYYTNWNGDIQCDKL